MQVLKIKENKNGSACIDIELNENDENKLKEICKFQKKKYNKEFIKTTLLRTIKNYIKKENKSE